MGDDWQPLSAVCLVNQCDWHPSSKCTSLQIGMWLALPNVKALRCLTSPRAFNPLCTDVIWVPEMRLSWKQKQLTHQAAVMRQSGVWILKDFFFLVLNLSWVKYPHCESPEGFFWFPNSVQEFIVLFWNRLSWAFGEWEREKENEGKIKKREEVGNKTEGEGSEEGGNEKRKKGNKRDNEGRREGKGDGKRGISKIWSLSSIRKKK